MRFLKIFATVSIDFVALLSSIVASTSLLVNAGCCILTTFIVRYLESISNILLQSFCSPIKQKTPGFLILGSFEV